MWPPLPVSRTSSASAAPVIGPSRSPTWPTSMVGSQCRQKIRSTPSSAPSLDQPSSAPPGMTSSAGWNSSRTRPGSRPPRAPRPARGRRRAAPAVCTSCPQACATPGDRCCAHGSVVRSSTGSASRSARRATSGPVAGADVGDQPGVAGSGSSREPASSRRLATRSVVRSSCQDSSGWACRSRRQVEEVVGRACRPPSRRARARRRAGHVRTRLVHRLAVQRIRIAVVRREDPVGGRDGAGSSPASTRRADLVADRGDRRASGAAAARARRGPAPR